MATTSYAIALGSNRRHGRYGAPRRVLAAAAAAVARLGTVERLSSVRPTAAIGPAGRAFANAVLILATDLGPAELLAALKQIERNFGRRPGRRWGPRVLDLDIILWSGGCWAGEGLIVPHPGMRDRRFVLDPLAEVAPEWRDPITGARVRQLAFRKRTPVPVDPRTPGS
ncbi:MAG TPA: 2-amino-4-hydroxy-6-hydroxymethyldihydropteridine diphosphokinase [Allosphingosinicella sp.]|nr:2-amino-4-hydroxy-6-hydroxymethyldihydropteridine diphosphokinase [Allosphingosinicella sp.]